jgi:hypothetical protein
MTDEKICSGEPEKLAFSIGLKIWSCAWQSPRKVEALFQPIRSGSVEKAVVDSGMNV